MAAEIYAGRKGAWDDPIATIDGDEVYAGRKGAWDDPIATIDGDEVYAGRKGSWDDPIATIDGDEVYAGRKGTWDDPIATIDGAEVYSGRKGTWDDPIATIEGDESLAGAAAAVVVLVLRLVDVQSGESNADSDEAESTDDSSDDHGLDEESPGSDSTGSYSHSTSSSSSGYGGYASSSGDGLGLVLTVLIVVGLVAWFKPSHRAPSSDTSSSASAGDSNVTTPTPSPVREALSEVDLQHVDPAHRQMVSNWLLSNPAFGKPAQLADCRDCEGGRLPADWGWENQHPFYALGDFNRDGQLDLAIVSRHGDLALFPGPLERDTNAFFLGNILCGQSTEFGQCSAEDHGSYIYFSAGRNQLICGGYATETSCSVRAVDRQWTFYSGTAEEWERAEVVAPAGRWSDRLFLNTRPVTCELPDGVWVQGDDENRTVPSGGDWADLGPEFLKTIRFQASGDSDLAGVCHVQNGRTITSEPGDAQVQTDRSVGVVESGIPPSGDSPTLVGGKISQPTKLKDVRPVYPQAALLARAQGVVVVEAIIGPNGRVTDARVLGSVPLLDQAALDAVRQWEFTSTLLDGVPVPVIMTVTVTFSLP